MDGWRPDGDIWQKVRPRTDSKFHYQGEEFTANAIIARGNECLALISRLGAAMERYQQERLSREKRE